jgi:hypothetical protein
LGIKQNKSTLTHPGKSSLDENTAFLQSAGENPSSDQEHNTGCAL